MIIEDISYCIDKHFEGADVEASTYALVTGRNRRQLEMVTTEKKLLKPILKSNAIKCHVMPKVSKNLT